MAEVGLREASDAEIAAVFRANANHIVATLDSEPVVYIRLQTIEGRRWGTINMLSTVAPSAVAMVFYTLKRRLKEERVPIHATATADGSGRLLRLIGLVPTDETVVGKRVWVWTPE